MAKEIKTVADVQKVPAMEHIDTMVYGKGTCPFCGSHLRSEIVGFGRDKCEQFYPCDCEVAQAAVAHNKRAKELKQEAWLLEEEKRQKEENRRREEEARKPVTITAAEMLCVASGCILPGVEPIPADDKVGYRLKRAGYGNGNAKERLLLYAYMNDFSEGLEKAAEEIVLYVKATGATWDTDIIPKVKELCSKYAVPEQITL